MESTGTQVAFFQHLKTQLPPHIAIVDEIAEILGISNDSAYRRIRGETPISLDEIQKLAIHFKVSLDKFLHLQSDSFVFTGHLTNASDHLLEQWMQDSLRNLLYINSFKHKHMYFHARDIPHLYYFAVPEFWAFKSFVFKKSILLYEQLKGVKFSMEEQLRESHPELAQKILNEYIQIPSSEIWNIYCANATLRQFEFYRSANIFETKEDIDRFCQSFLLLMDHLEKQAETGLKSRVGESHKPTGAPFHLYNNEFILGDNTGFAELDTTKITFLSHSVISFLATTDERFNNHMHNNLKNLIRKSTQLSEVGEKDRIIFFSRIRERIKAVIRA